MPDKKRFKEAHEVVEDLMHGRFDKKELGREVLSQFGGIRGLASELKLDHQSLDPGDKTRLLIMKQVLSLVSELDDDFSNIENESEEDIAAKVKAIGVQIAELQEEHDKLFGNTGSDTGGP
jgi:hypothetical protein